MNVVFFGNHTVGVTALAALRTCCSVVGVVAHPIDPEDGIRYQSVFDAAMAQGLPVIRGRAKEAGVREFVAGCHPDLLWITDYRYLLPAPLLALAPRGAVNLHPSLLPRYRGRAPVNWAILRGEREIGLTAHMVDEGMDTGDVLAQIRVSLEADEDVGDALDKLMPHYAALPCQVIAGLRSGTIERVPQNAAEATAFPARTPADGAIDWNMPAIAVRDLVRAVAAPYPGAFSTLSGHRVTVWRARIVTGRPDVSAGTVLSVTPEGPVVQCGDDALLLLRADTDLPVWAEGARFS